MLDVQMLSLTTSPSDVDGNSPNGNRDVVMDDVVECDQARVAKICLTVSRMLFVWRSGSKTDQVPLLD